MSTPLSTTFHIDPEAPWVREHNKEARHAMDAWQNGRPIRLPLICDDSAIQHGLYASAEDVDYELYYNDPDEMVRVQLEAARLRRELPIYDFELGVLPESWPITVDFWPVPSQGWIGCPITYRKDASPVQTRLNLSRLDCDRIQMPDPHRGGILSKTREFVDHIRSRWEGREYLGRPIGPVYSGVDHNGVFAMALDVRGDELLTDFYEDPDFARRFLLKMGEWCDALERAWKESSPWMRDYFRNTDHGIDMLSPQTYEEFILPVIVEINRRRRTPLPSGWHYCGSGIHLVRVFKEQYPLERLSDVTFPLLDIAEIRDIVGDGVQIKAVIEDGLVAAGPPSIIEKTVKSFREKAGENISRTSLSVGDMLKGTPLEHRKALYQAVRAA